MLRIVSDLHVFDGAGRIRRLSELDPLLDGMDSLLVNGDACDTQVGTTPGQVAELKAYLNGRAPQVTLVTGNHDPDISDVHEQLLADGRVWATHGDVFFPDATPWSAIVPEIRRRIAAAQAQRGLASLDDVATRLLIFREICHGLPIRWDLRRRDFFAKAQRLLHDLRAPARIRAVLRAWKNAPELAATLVAAQRATAQVVVFGHIHRPSIHHRAGRIIINTGAFAGPMGAWTVDIDNDLVRVRRIERRRGAWHAGSILSEFPLRSAVPANLSHAA